MHSKHPALTTIGFDADDTLWQNEQFFRLTEERLISLLEAHADPTRVRRSLLKVSNVGPRIALGVLSGMSVDGFYQCVRDKDLVSLTKIPGVGRKTGERLLLEMADRLPESLGSDAAQLPVRSKAEGEAHGALLALGYKPGEVVRMLKDLDSVRLSTEEMIREALKRVHRERVGDR